MEFDFAQLKPQERYKLLTALVVPRPIAWVTTLNRDGSVNAAPFSFFNAMGSDPGLLVLSVGNHERTRPKDTAANIKRRGFFVVHMVSEALAPAMNLTATEFPEGMSEVEAAGLELAPSVHVPVPRIAQAPAGFECKLHSVLEIGHNRLIIGEVLQAFVHDEFVADAHKLHIKTEALQLIGRMHGRGGYTRTREIFEMPRISLEEWQARQMEKTP
ncbi:flavin reductase family protein [Calidithermus roseus]|uniref:Flavin reductase like domain protein n=1 Tax=Calidithermus roseus TaxID=1644118 RepID=A0A399F3Y7_9DEIN|nr:flavin reductase family protein [Calidithermus roseus]RIH89582.1 Flavin reductase like domain protein [Calidithermus roseus]